MFEEAVTERAKKNPNTAQFLLDFPIEKTTFLGYNVCVKLWYTRIHNLLSRREATIGGNRK